MPRNILVTGTGGYIGGSIFEDLIAKTEIVQNKAKIYAAVRSSSQCSQLLTSGFNAVSLDLLDETSVKSFIVHNRVSIIINTASSFSPDIATNLIRALGEVQKQTKEKVFYIHTSIAALYAVEGGWPYGRVEDADMTIIEKQKELSVETPNPIRATDIAVAETTAEENVEFFNLVVPTVYGRGTGRFRQLSAKIPPIIKISVKDKIVHKYHKDANETVTHISDVVAMYSILVEKILLNEIVSTGFYFVVGHKLHWWNLLDKLAHALHQKGLISQTQVKTWPNDEVAAEKLGLPAAFIGTMLSNNSDMVPINPHLVGWQPKWSEMRFLNSIDVEIVDALKADFGSETSLFADA